MEHYGKPFHKDSRRSAGGKACQQKRATPADGKLNVTWEKSAGARGIEAIWLARQKVTDHSQEETARVTVRCERSVSTWFGLGKRMMPQDTGATYIDSCLQ